MRPIIIFLFVLVIWGAVALDVNVTSPNVDKSAEDEGRDKYSQKRPRELLSVGVALLDAAMKALEQENTQITEVNRQQELTIGQLQLQVSQLSTNMMKLQEESEKQRAQLSTKTMKLREESEKLRAQLSTKTMKLQEESEKLRAQLSTKTMKLQEESEKQRAQLSANTMKLQEESEKQRAQLSTNTMKLQEEIKKLRAQLNSTPSHSSDAIGFHVRLTNSINTPVTQTLVANRVEYNSGGGYDPTTGVFTAPVTGLYLFLANMAADRIGTEAWISMVLDNGELCAAFSRYSTEMEMASCHAATRMVKGQTVKILAKGRDKRRIRGGYWSTFTGVLIQAED